ncbi:4'-phosphopantetheinyl transferase superfamily protein [Coprobacter sp.]
MPLISIQEIIPGIKIALWKPEENSEELLSLLNSSRYRELAASCKTEKRKIEKLSSRLLTNLLQKKETDIFYDNNGSPYLPESSEYISISHTQNCIAVAISSHPVGIDVENIAPKVLLLKEKFLNETEIKSIDPGNELIHTLLLWSAKESVFKRMHSSGINFKQNIHISDFIPGKQDLFYARETHTPQQNTYQIHYKVYPRFILTICF